jgi:hypothetical protein
MVEPGKNTIDAVAKACGIVFFNEADNSAIFKVIKVVRVSCYAFFSFIPKSITDETYLFLSMMVLLFTALNSVNQGRLPVPQGAGPPRPQGRGLDASTLVAFGDLATQIELLSQVLGLSNLPNECGNYDPTLL